MSQKIDLPLDTGRIQDFIDGAREATDKRAKSALSATAILASAVAWSAWKKRR